MQIETLKMFCDLVETQTFARAAERNFVTQSAVSRQIQKLEDKFTHRLLERTRGRHELNLTPAGKVFTGSAKMFWQVMMVFGKKCAVWNE